VPSPKLEADPGADLQRYLAAKEKALHSYGWIDRQRGVVHIPIERAMDLTVEESRQQGAR
jgi:hypothetical protein